MCSESDKDFETRSEEDDSDQEAPDEVSFRSRPGKSVLATLSADVIKLLRKKGTLSINELVTLLSKADCANAKSQKRKESMLRRRVYDALNVLCGARLIYRENSNMLSPDQHNLRANELTDISYCLNKQMELSRIRFANLYDKTFAYKNLVEKNVYGETASPTSEESKVKVPFVAIHYSKHAAVDIYKSPDEKLCIITSTSAIVVEDEMPMLNQLGFGVLGKRGTVSMRKKEMMDNGLPEAAFNVVAEVFGQNKRLKWLTSSRDHKVGGDAIESVQ